MFFKTLACMFQVLFLSAVVTGHGTIKAEQKPLFGAFIGDRPGMADIAAFERDYGIKPEVVLVFLDWEASLGPSLIDTVGNSGTVLLVTWEPWHALQKKLVDFEALLSGAYDQKIKDFAQQLKSSGHEIWLRFGHEMNGDWYPWGTTHISANQYRLVFQYVKDVFDTVGTSNVQWVFSINWENVPPSNDYHAAYPGDEYVDLIAIDGYNWGTSQTWSEWLSFERIFKKKYKKLWEEYGKPIVIAEFGSSSAGGDKSRWIEHAFKEMKKMPELKAVVLFNQDKETDWRFPADQPSGQELRKQLKRR